MRHQQSIRFAAADLADFFGAQYRVGISQRFKVRQLGSEEVGNRASIESTGQQCHALIIAVTHAVQKATAEKHSVSRKFRQNRWIEFFGGRVNGTTAVPRLDARLEVIPALVSRDDSGFRGQNNKIHAKSAGRGIESAIELIGRLGRPVRRAKSAQKIPHIPPAQPLRGGQFATIIQADGNPGVIPLVFTDGHCHWQTFDRNIILWLVGTGISV